MNQHRGTGKSDNGRNNDIYPLYEVICIIDTRSSHKSEILLLTVKPGCLAQTCIHSSGKTGTVDGDAFIS